MGHGRPGTTVIPEQWAASHETIASKTHGASVTLRRAATGTGSWDADEERTTPAEGVAYAVNVAAGITAEASRAGAAVAAGERVDRADYLVSLGSHLPVVEGDTVHVNAHLSDPLLVGRVLIVEQVLLGSNRFERDLRCVLVDDNNPPA